MAECQGSFSQKKFMGYEETIDDCATECRGVAAMFTFGTCRWVHPDECFTGNPNPYGGGFCETIGSVNPVTKCKCFCEMSSSPFSQCQIVHNEGFNLYAFKKNLDGRLFRSFIHRF